MRILAIGGGRGLDQIVDAIASRYVWQIVGVLDDKVTREPYKGVVSAYAALRMLPLESLTRRSSASVHLSISEKGYSMNSQKREYPSLISSTPLPTLPLLLNLELATSFWHIVTSEAMPRSAIIISSQPSVQSSITTKSVATVHSVQE